MEATQRARVTAAAAAFTWRAHPLRDQPPWRSALLLSLIGGVSVLVAASFDAAMGALALAVLSGSMARYLLPTHYAVDVDGVAQRLWIWRRLPWSAVRRIDRHEDGLFLSPFVRPSRLDSFRGQFLPFGAQVDDARLTEYVESRVGR